MIFRVINLVMVWFAVSAVAQSTTNSPVATNAPPAATQVWDFADQLDLTSAQRDALFKVRDEYEAARTAVAAPCRLGMSARNSSATRPRS